MADIWNTAYSNLIWGCQSIQESAIKSVIELNEVLHDPEGFQKICLVALSILQGINYYRDKPCLPKFEKMLDIANSFDFYSFLKIPYHLFYLVDSDKIDEFKTLNEIEKALCANWIGREGIDRDPEIHLFAQKCLSDLLEHMTQFEVAFVNDARFKSMLHQWLVEELNVHAAAYPAYWDQSRIDINGIAVIQIEDTKFETASNFAFICVDLMCVPAFLGEWKLLDLISTAESLGKFRLFSWMPSHNLDSWIRGVLCTAFLLKFCDACTCLMRGNLGPATKKRAQWDLVVSAAEFLFNFAAFCKVRTPAVIFLTFIAKSLGVASIISRPNRYFFEEIVPSA
ncbi:MAG: hypothetical protein H0V82_12030 [Candidatus Protochlamydia sp.]|nr:hypothetical protein [Candidatus Protochlamydia sp.]